MPRAPDQETPAHVAAGHSVAYPVPSAFHRGDKHKVTAMIEIRYVASRPEDSQHPLPRDPNAFKAVAAAALASLVRGAREVERPTSKTPAREAFIEWVLDQLF